METLSPNTKDKSGIARAAHILQCFLPWRAHQILEQEGVSPESIAIGAIVAAFERDEYHFHREVYGAREYGSRVIDHNEELRLSIRRDLLNSRLKRGGSELERITWVEMLAEAVR